MRYDIIIIGGGPAGYPAAATAVSQGLKTLLIEAGELGGTCLNCGCIPTKTFCRSADAMLQCSTAAEFGVILPPGDVKADMERIVERKNEVVMQLRESVAATLRGVDIRLGKARFASASEIEVDGELFSADRIIVATGSRPASLPIPGSELCVDSTALLDMAQLPESLAVIGGGVIGMEFASVFNAFGCEVTVIEYCKEILPGIEKDIAKRLRSALSKRGVKFHLSAAAESVSLTPEGLREITFTAKGKPQTATAHTVLMAVGRKAVVPEGFTEAGGQLTPRGAIAVDENFLTSLPGVYAVGDVNGICQLAHAATAQALRVMGEPVDLSPVPACVFTVPEIAATGLTEEQAEKLGIPYHTVKIPLRGNGKALAMGETDGLVKLLLSETREQILGCSIIGPHAADLIMEPSLAISAKLPASAILAAIHPHPTLSELLPSALGAIH